MSEWISVKDRLPDIGKTVLTLDKWGHICGRKLYQFRYTVATVAFRPDGLVPGKDITHWMPLPEPQDGVSMERGCERLAAIEDILGDDYDLNHLRELVTAEQDGRLVVLPCKVGTPIYLVHQVPGTKKKNKQYRVDEYVIDRFTVGGTGIPMITACSADNEWEELIDGTQLGTEYWLAREEAEAALKEETDNG